MLMRNSGDSSKHQSKPSEDESLNEAHQQFQPIEGKRHHEGYQETYYHQQYFPRRHVAKETEGETDKTAQVAENLQNTNEGHYDTSQHPIQAIDNLPDGGCVEVPVLVDATGLQATRFGPLPPQLAALNAAHMYVHELMVQAVLERDRGAALQALMLDPLSAAVCSPDEIRSMFDEMWEAEREDLVAFVG